MVILAQDASFLIQMVSLFVPHWWYTCTRPHFYHMWYIPQVHIEIKCHCFTQLYTYTCTTPPPHPLLTTPTPSLLTKTKDNTADSREQHSRREHWEREQVETREYRTGVIPLCWVEVSLNGRGITIPKDNGVDTIENRATTPLRAQW